MSKSTEHKEETPIAQRLRSCSNRLPRDAAEGLTNLHRLVHSTPIHTRPETLPGRSQPPSDEPAINPLQLSDTETSDTELDNTLDNTIVGGDQSAASLFVSFNDSTNTMSTEMTLEEAKEKIRQLELNYDRACQDSDRYLKEYHAERERLSTIKTASEVEIKKLQDEVKDLTSKINVTPPKPEDLGEAVVDIQRQVENLKINWERANRLNESLAQSASYGLKSTDYSRHRDTINKLGKEPEPFERATILRSPLEFLKDFSVYANSINGDKSYWFPGLAKYLKGQARTFYDAYSSSHPPPVDFEDWSRAFVNEFDRLTIDELKKSFVNRKQREDEDVSTFATDLRRLMDKDGMPESVQIKIFQCSVKEELQNVILGFKPRTMHEAVEQARVEETRIGGMKIAKSKTQSAELEMMQRNQAEVIARLNAITDKQDRRVEFSDRSRDRSRDRYRSNYRGNGYNNRDRSGSRDRRYNAPDRSKSPHYRDSRRDSYNNSRDNSRDSQRGRSDSKSPHGNGRNYNRNHSRDHYYNNRSNSNDRYQSGYRDNRRYNDDRSSSRDRGRNYDSRDKMQSMTTKSRDHLNK